MSKALDLANDLSSFELKYDSGTLNAVTLTNSVVDGGQLLGIDLSGLANAGDYFSVNVSNPQDGEALVFSSGVLTNQTQSVNSSSIDHDALTNFVANEHIDWTSTTENFSTTGTISSGGITATGLNVSTGTISTNGTERISNAGALSNVTAAASIITSGTFADAQIAASNVTQYQAALSIAETQISFTSSFIELTDLSASTAAAGTTGLAYNDTTGAFTYTPPDLSSYALSANVPTSLNDLTDVTVTGSEPAGEALVSDGNGGFSPDPLTPLMLAIALG